MATSTPSQNPSGPGSGGGDRNRGRSRNRNGGNGGNRSRNRNRSQGDRPPGERGESGERRNAPRSFSGGGNSSYTKEKVPRRAPSKSFFQKILGIFGLGDAADAKKARPSAPNPLARVGSTRVPEPGSRPEPAAGRNAPRRNDGPPRDPADRPPREARPPREPKPRREPENVEVTCERLYVGNLSYEAGEDDLKQLFGGVGTVQLAEVVSHKGSQRSKGYAFLEMASIDEARRAVSELHDRDFMGRKLVVSGAKSVGRQENGASRDERDERDED